MCFSNFLTACALEKKYCQFCLKIALFDPNDENVMTKIARGGQGSKIF
jgi:hypothetical protein